MGKVGIFGDSILKGVQVEGSGGRYVVNDFLGFSAIASRAGLSVENFSKFGCTITKAWSYIQKMFKRIDADMVFMDFGGNDCDFNWDEVSRKPLEVHRPRTDYYDFVNTYNDVVDYIKACLLSEKTSDNMKELSAALYRCNQAANTYFDSQGGN